MADTTKITVKVTPVTDGAWGTDKITVRTTSITEGATKHIIRKVKI